VVVADVLFMQDFVRETDILDLNSRTPLHGKTLQWQAKHQQDTE
jgi:hypothetical protein